MIFFLCMYINMTRVYGACTCVFAGVCTYDKHQAHVNQKQFDK